MVGPMTATAIHGFSTETHCVGVHLVGFSTILQYSKKGIGSMHEEPKDFPNGVLQDLDWTRGSMAAFLNIVTNFERSSSSERSWKYSSAFKTTLLALISSALVINASWPLRVQFINNALLVHLYLPLLLPFHTKIRLFPFIGLPAICLEYLDN